MRKRTDGLFSICAFIVLGICLSSIEAKTIYNYADAAKGVYNYADVAKGVKVKASAVALLGKDNRAVPERAIDGNFKTAWVANFVSQRQGKQWLKLDFGKVISFNLIELYSGGQDFAFFVSDDDKAYRKIAEIKGNEKFAVRYEFPKPIRCRFLKYVVSAERGNNWVSVTELRVCKILPIGVRISSAISKLMNNRNALKELSQAGKVWQRKKSVKLIKDINEKIESIKYLQSELSKAKTSDWHKLANRAETVLTSAGAVYDEVKDVLSDRFNVGPSDCVMLGDDNVRFFISRKTGDIIEGWNCRTYEKYFLRTSSEYIIHTQPKDIKAKSAGDKVVNISKGQGRVSFYCSNSAFSAKQLKFVKTYEIDETVGGMVMRYTLENSVRRRRHISWFVNVKLADSLCSGGKGYYYIPFLSASPKVSVSSVSSPRPIKAQYDAWDFRVSAIVNPARGYTASTFLYLEDGRFCPCIVGRSPVLPPEIRTGLRKMAGLPDYRLFLQRNGWRFCAAKFNIAPKSKMSASLVYQIIRGDSSDWLRRYYKLPAIRQLYTNYKYPVSKYVKNIMAIGGWMKATVPVMTNSVIEGYQNFARKLGRGYYPMIFEYHYGSQGDFRTDEPDAKWLKQRISVFKKLAPNVKVGGYVIPHVIDPMQDIAIKHPDWFARDRWGRTICIDYNIRRLKVINNESANLIVSQLGGVMKYFDWDTLFMDAGVAIPGAGPDEFIDWDSFYPHYKVAEMFCNIAKRIKQIFPEKIIYANGPNQPYTDISLIEIAPGPYIWDDWRILSEMIYSAKMNQQLGRRNTLMYWYMNSKAELRYVQYIINGTLIPFIGNIEPGTPKERQEIILRRIPYVQAVYEIKDAKLIDAKVKPWWRAQETNFDVWALRQGKTNIVTVINHYKRDKAVEIEASAADLKLDKSKPVYIWVSLLKDPKTLTKENERVIISERFEVIKNVGDKLKIKLDIRSKQMKIITISQVPAFVCKSSNYYMQFRLTDGMGIHLRGSGQIEVQADTSGGVGLIWPNGKRIASIFVDSRNVPFKKITECNHQFVTVDIPAGKHVIRAEEK